eukprot:TRINITY_DN15848_c0_g1_i1.p1 TRINITY_DN15848_c0_g1~~TRINITY_DN15848_c0_g1_i1.p1  ORF type:complete len:362 (-),score=121.66 TRINITY_DN15848_c0_g1_i1:91-1134(-)
MATTDNAERGPLKDLLQGRILELQAQDAAEKAQDKSDRKKLRQLLSPAKTDAEKFELLQDNYLIQIRACRKLEQQQAEAVRKYDRCDAELGLVRTSLVKTESVNATLKELCSKLQKQRTLLEAEMKRTQEEEAQKRADLMQRVDSSIADITSKIEVSSQEKVKTDQANELLQVQVQKADAELRLLSSTIQAKDVELQLADARLRESNSRAALSEATARQNGLAVTDLQQQLSEYISKFQMFEGSMKESHSTMQEFKTQITKSMQMIKKLEKEKMELLTREKQSAVKMLQLATDAEEAKRTSSVLMSKCDKLQILCRELQKQNMELRQQQQQLSSGTEVATAAVAPDP